MFNTLRKFFVGIYIILIYFDSVLHFASANLCIYNVLIYFDSVLHFTPANLCIYTVLIYFLYTTQIFCRHLYHSNLF